jgi:hypothetical protein
VQLQLPRLAAGQQHCRLKQLHLSASNATRVPEGWYSSTHGLPSTWLIGGYFGGNISEEYVHLALSSSSPSGLVALEGSAPYERKPR